MRMNKLVMLLMGLIVSMSSFALGKDSVNAVIMESYDQALADYDASLTLKNNTSQNIHNVSYRIIYLDMKGNVIDYKDFTSKVEIEPGLARIVKVKAFQAGNDYSYYKSKYNDIASHRFKVRFKLKGYNDAQAAVESKQATNVTDSGNGVDFLTPDSAWVSFFAIVAILMILGIYIGLYVLIAVMAQKRNRSAIGWLLLSFFLTPLLVIIILLCIGKTNDGYYQAT